MAKTRSTSGSRSEPVPGRYLICLGSFAGAHGPIAVPVMQGPRKRFIFCPSPTCHVRAFLGGSHYSGRDVGHTLKDIKRGYPRVTVVVPPNGTKNGE